jgi:hypothetical protein
MTTTETRKVTVEAAFTSGFGLDDNRGATDGRLFWLRGRRLPLRRRQLSWRGRRGKRVADFFELVPDNSFCAAQIMSAWLTIALALTQNSSACLQWTSRVRP